MRKRATGQWSEDDVAKLRALAGKMPIRELVSELRRSRGAVTAKAFSLRISLNVRDVPADQVRRTRIARRG
jgi:hypothetical protein